MSDSDSEDNAEPPINRQRLDDEFEQEDIQAAIQRSMDDQEEENQLGLALQLSLDEQENPDNIGNPDGNENTGRQCESGCQ